MMVETVVSSALPVDELLSIRKNRLEPDHQSGREKRICIVTGTHGDELEGQYESENSVADGESEGNCRYLSGTKSFGCGLDHQGHSEI